MQELWKHLDEFPGYAISNFGQVLNLRRDTLLSTTRNQSGLAIVGLQQDRRHTTRSVSLLVADSFLPRENDIFDTPINLDGDRLNCQVWNLMWRPRWHALEYHKQFSRAAFGRVKQCIELEETGEKFVGVREPAIKYGFLYYQIMESYMHGINVFPNRFHFRRI